MIPKRIYNPAQLSPDELKASFVARHEKLESMLSILAEQKPGHPCQHVVLVGPRGMGKTTLGLRFLQEVRERPDLASDWQPVPFPEESYDIIDLADFWVAALHHLTRATGDVRWEAKADAVVQDEAEPQRQAAYALAALLEYCQDSSKRLILFVENLDLVLEQLSDEREVHALRAALMEHPEIMVVGSANAVFDAIRSHGEPFYEFFRLIRLQGLNQEECNLLLEALVTADGTADLAQNMDQGRGRLETIRHLTGGNPRLLTLTCRLLIESPLGSAFEDLERLIDEQTPYFKASIEVLPVQARRVFHCLASAWVPMLTKEVSAAAKLSSSHASAQLRQLKDKGYVREIHLREEKRCRYEVADRFYNIYYVLRFSRPGRERLARLVSFLHDLFGPTAIQPGGSKSRHTEAESHARRAAEHAPDNCAVLLTLSTTLGSGGKLAEAIKVMERALSTKEGVPEELLGGVAKSLMMLLAAGQAAKVKQLMANANLTERLEALWHAVRAELGEPIEPLPAEIFEAVKEVRRQIAEARV